jgi:hypothetical protein
MPELKIETPNGERGHDHLQLCGEANTPYIPRDSALATLYASGDASYLFKLVRKRPSQLPGDGSFPHLGGRAERSHERPDLTVRVREPVGYRSGQTGQTVNLLAKPSEVRILPPPLRVSITKEKFEEALRE